MDQKRIASYSQVKEEEKKKTSESSSWLEVPRLGDPYHGVRYKRLMNQRIVEGQVIN